MVYQVPLNSVDYLAKLLKTMELKFSEYCYIDVEMNTLEDAYINIAKEEERLLN